MLPDYRWHLMTCILLSSIPAAEAGYVENLATLLRCKVAAIVRSRTPISMEERFERKFGRIPSQLPLLILRVYGGGQIRSPELWERWLEAVAPDTNIEAYLREEANFWEPVYRPMILTDPAALDHLPELHFQEDAAALRQWRELRESGWHLRNTQTPEFTTQCKVDFEHRAIELPGAMGSLPSVILLREAIQTAHRIHDLIQSGRIDRVKGQLGRLNPTVLTSTLADVFAMVMRDSRTDALIRMRAWRQSIEGATVSATQYSDTQCFVRASQEIFGAHQSMNLLSAREVANLGSARIEDLLTAVVLAEDPVPTPAPPVTRAPGPRDQASLGMDAYAITRLIPDFLLDPALFENWSELTSEQERSLLSLVQNRALTERIRQTSHVLEQSYPGRYLPFDRILFDAFYFLRTRSHYHSGAPGLADAALVVARTLPDDVYPALTQAITDAIPDHRTTELFEIIRPSPVWIRWASNSFNWHRIQRLLEWDRVRLVGAENMRALRGTNQPPWISNLLETFYQAHWIQFRAGVEPVQYFEQVGADYTYWPSTFVHEFHWSVVAEVIELALSYGGGDARPILDQYLQRKLEWTELMEANVARWRQIHDDERRAAEVRRRVWNRLGPRI